MTKDNFLFSLIGLLLGFIVGFFFANTTNQRGALTQTAQGQLAGLPADHPPVGANGASQASGVSQAEVQAALQRAKDKPDDFDAQMQAAELYYRIQRYEEAIELLTRANQLRPSSYEPLVNLGNANFDAGRFPEAERWYAAALSKRPDDVNVRTDLGLTFMFREPPDLDRAVAEFRRSLERQPTHAQTLQNLTVALTRKGEAAEAQATLARLEGVNPENPALPRLRADLEKLRSQ